MASVLFPGMLLALFPPPSVVPAALALVLVGQLLAESLLESPPLVQQELVQREQARAQPVPDWSAGMVLMQLASVLEWAQVLGTILVLVLASALGRYRTSPVR